MRSFFNASLRFGLLAIPVGLVPTKIDRGGFKTLHRECDSPILRPAYCPVHERVVADEETVRGFEFAPGEFVPVETEELAALAPEASHAVEISCLVDADRLDPSRITDTYFLAPSKTSVGRRPYVLLHRLLVQRGNVAIARLVFKGVEWLVAIAPHPSRNVLLLQKLVFSEDLVSPTDIEVELRDVELQDRELDAGGQLAAKLWRTKPSPQLFESGQKARVQALVDAKLAGGQVVCAPRASAEPNAQTPSVPAVDLTEQLRASVRARRTPKTKPRAGARAAKA